MLAQTTVLKHWKLTSTPGVQKTGHLIFAHNFGICWLIFKIL